MSYFLKYFSPNPQYNGRRLDGCGNLHKVTNRAPFTTRVERKNDIYALIWSYWFTVKIEPHTSTLGRVVEKNDRGVAKVCKTDILLYGC